MENYIIASEMMRAKPVLYNIINRYGSIKARKFITREELARLISDPPYKPIRKKIRGKVRELFVPSKSLMILLKAVLEIILYDFAVSDIAHGGVLGRSVVTNAQPHLGSSSFFRIDFKDYYPSITKQMVVNRLRDLFEKNLSIGFFRNCGLIHLREARALANIIGRLATFRDILPQGAPTSPYLQNLVLYDLDKKILELSREHNINYTRFIDDMTFSSVGSCIPIEFRRKLMDLIRMEVGHLLKFNREKIHYKTGQAKPQVITGITLSLKDNVPQFSLSRRQREKFRSILHSASVGIVSRKEAWGVISWVKMAMGKLPKRLKEPFLQFIGNCYPDRWDRILDHYKDLL